MTKYILVYKSKAPLDWSLLPKEEVSKIVEAWGEWVGSMGPMRKDSMPFKFGGKSVSYEGTNEADNLLNGFAIIDAKDFDEALSFAKNAPSVKDDTGSIEVYEAFGL
ncbi:MAG: hypothetical protein JWN26_422 [Candidatus Saccharibacteria bacterium]|nr:hypothetical protein [Candidatus Saccharibacteria bacterium]